jgi:hypothetical protein
MRQVAKAAHTGAMGKSQTGKARIISSQIGWLVIAFHVLMETLQIVIAGLDPPAGRSPFGAA